MIRKDRGINILMAVLELPHNGVEYNITIKQRIPFQAKHI